MKLGNIRKIVSLSAAFMTSVLFISPLSYAWPIPRIDLNNARFITQSAPADVFAGQKYKVSITFMNNGVAPWFGSKGYCLMSQNPAKNIIWGVQKIVLSRKEIILPKRSKTFIFEITAPAAPGVYNFQWQMYKEGGGFFGERSHNISVNVKPQIILDAVGDRSTYEDQKLEIKINAQGIGDISYSASNLPAGASFNPSTHTFTWTPAHGQKGTYPGVHFEATNGAAAVSEDITITALKTVIFGTIYQIDNTGQNIPLEGARVRILDITKTMVYGEGFSGPSGHFDIFRDNYLNGNYFIEASKDTFKTYYAFALLRDNSMMPFVAVLYPLDENDFVVASGNRLILQKNRRPFYFSIANQYNLFYAPITMVDEVFRDAKAMGINVIRTWGFCDGEYKDGVSFQPEKRVYHRTGFERMDEIIKKARENGMRLIIPFVNYWPNFGGMDAYVRWANGTNREEFYTNAECRSIYEDYVTYFLNRTNPLTGIKYKDDPTILIWELANEPESPSDWATGDTFYNWANDMSRFIKGIDPNHMVSTGEEGWYMKPGYANWGTDYIRNSQLPNIDICSFHLLMDDRNFSESQASQWVIEHIDDAHFVVGKPVYCGEFGKKVYRMAPDAVSQMAKRNELYSSWYQLFLDRVIDGGGFWLLSAHDFPDHDNYTVYSSDTEYPGYEHPLDVETNSIISNFSAQMAQRRALGYFLPIVYSSNRLIDEGLALEFYADISNPSNRSFSFSSANLPSGSTFDPFGHFSWPATVAGNYKGIELNITSGAYTNSTIFDISVTDVNGDNTPKIGDTFLPLIVELDKNTTLDNAIDLWAITSDDLTSDENMIYTVSKYYYNNNVSVTLDSNRYVDIVATNNYAGPVTLVITATDEAGLTATKLHYVGVKNNGTIRVPSDYPMISEANQNALYGDTILVAPGTYNEWAHLGAGVSLVSEQGRDVTVINGGASGGYGAKIDGFTVRNDIYPDDVIRGFFSEIKNNIIENCPRGGIDIYGMKSEITNNIIRNNGLGIGSHYGELMIINNIIEHNGAGIDLYAPKNTLICNNIIRENKTNYTGGGIRFNQEVNCKVLNNVIIENEASEGGGLYIVSCGADLFISNNIILKNKAQSLGGGIRTYNANPTIVFYDVWNNTDYYGVEPPWPGEGNIYADPEFVDELSGDFHLQAGSPCINTGNPLEEYNDRDGTRNDMGVYGGPHSL